MSQINQIKDAADIVDVISRRLDLKQSGTSFKALCPFHSENSPSFFVNQQLQRYRCFGCGASGDVYEFLQQYEGMTFYEALQHLSQETGIELKQYSKTKDDDTREKLLEILQLSARYYNYLLTEHKSGETARKYLKQRGVFQDSIKLFQLGYATSAWDGLLQYLSKKKKYAPELILKTGLIIRNNSGRYFDRLRSRVVFPLKNHRGQVVGFSGRVLNSTQDEENKQPKYINTPETELYHKAKMLYGYSELFQHLRNKKEAIVCEGEFDVISSHQTHVSQIVAIKGSALTQEQAKLLERTVEKVILTLDSDEAGIKATKRAIQVVRGTRLDLRVIDLGSISQVEAAQDIDDLIKKDPALWREVSKQSTSAYEFLIEVALRKHDLGSAIGRRKIVDELAPVLKQIQHEVEKEFYLGKLAEKLGVTIVTLRKDIEKFGDLVVSAKSSTPSNQQNITLDPAQQLEEYLMFLLLHANDDEVVARAQELQKMNLNLSTASLLIQKLTQYRGVYTLAGFSASLPEDLKATLMEWYHHPQYTDQLEQISWQKEWQKILSRYQRHKLNTQIEEMNEEISKIEREQPESSEQLVEAKLKEIAQFQAKLKLLN